MRFIITLPKDQFIGTSTLIIKRNYAAVPSNKGGKVPVKDSGSRKKAAEQSTGPRGGRNMEGSGDSRLEVIRKVSFNLRRKG